MYSYLLTSRALDTRQRQDDWCRLVISDCGAFRFIPSLYKIPYVSNDVAKVDALVTLPVSTFLAAGLFSEVSTDVTAVKDSLATLQRVIIVGGIYLGRTCTVGVCKPGKAPISDWSGA